VCLFVNENKVMKKIAVPIECKQYFYIIQRKSHSMNSIIIVLFLATTLLFTSIRTNSASTNNNTAFAQEQKIPIPKSHSIKIIFPTAGLQIPVNANITVKGIVYYGLATPPPKRTPTDTSGTSSCFVSIQVNGVLPYHRVTATGHNGGHDYSTWKYTIDPKSIPLKQGPDNKIAARLSCPQAANLESRYASNFTGVSGTTPASSPIDNANQSKVKPSATTSLFHPHSTI
jgi:hypothetical protein